VSTAWLAQHLRDPDLVLLHVGERAEYDARHLPGAQFIDFHHLAHVAGMRNGLTLEMLPADDLRTYLQTVGISTRSNIVVYYGGDWVSPATRIVFTLDAAGLDHVALLDGGMPAWVKDAREVATTASPAPPGQLAPLQMRPTIVDADFVRSHAAAPGFALVDARAAAFYDGVQPGGPRGHQMSGHIPGAHSIPFDSVTTDDLKLKSPEELTAIFTKAGVKPADTVIGYCHIGQQATAMLFAARTLGHRVLLYDGSFEDWAQRGNPVEAPAKKNP